MKIAFHCGKHYTFLERLIPYFKERHEVREFRGGASRDMFDLMKWSDVSFFEWCDEFIIEASQLPKVCKMVCRLHRYEMYRGFVQRVHWPNVDELILVSPSMKTLVEMRCPEAADTRKHVIPNPMHLDGYVFAEHEPGYNIAYMGLLSEKKNPLLMVQVLAELKKVSNRYTMHIAGQWQAQVLKDYFEYMASELDLWENIKYYGWVTDVNLWLTDKDFILSTSYGEANPQVIAEAMAKGVKPLIHNYWGARDWFDHRFLWNTIDDLKQRISEPYESATYRKEVERFDMAKVMPELERVVAG